MTTAVETSSVTIREETGGIVFRSREGLPPREASKVDLGLDLRSNSPRDVIKHLIEQEGLPRTRPNDGGDPMYFLTLGTRKLNNDEPLGTQGVAEGAELTLHGDMTKG